MRGSVSPRGQGRWRVQVYLGRDPDTGKERRKERVVRAPHTREGKRTAELELARLLLEADPHHAEPVGDVTVAELLDRWCEMRSADWSPRNHEYTRQVIDRYLIPTFGTTLVRDLTGSMIDTWMTGLRTGGGRYGKGLKPGTIRRMYGVLRAGLNQAIKWGEIDRNPAHQATPPRPDRPKINPPSTDAILDLLNDITDPFWAAFLRLAATTGERRSQLLGLRWEDVDLDTGVATWRSAVVARDDGGYTVKGTKNGRIWRTALDAGTVGALNDHRTKSGHTTGFVFSIDGTEPITPRTVTNWWNRTRRRHPELADVRFHDLRHYVVTTLLSAGVDVRTVAGRVGHANPNVTLAVYSHFLPEADRTAADTIADILTPDD